MLSIHPPSLLIYAVQCIQESNKPSCQTTGPQKLSNLTKQPSGTVWIREVLSANPLAVNKCPNPGIEPGSPALAGGFFTI